MYRDILAQPLQVGRSLDWRENIEEQAGIKTCQSRKVSIETSLLHYMKLTFLFPEINRTARKSLLACFGFDLVDPSRDEENMLNQITSMTLGDQDRVGAIVDHQSVKDWLLDPRFGALLVHGNSRRHEPISPTSVACALIVHVFSRKLGFPTLYWFCGLHASGPRGGPLGMLQSLLCQFVGLSCCRCSLDDQAGLEIRDAGKLLKLFQKLLRRSSGDTPVVLVLDGISFYEDHHRRDIMGSVVRELTSLANSSPRCLIVLMTCPIRSSYVAHEPKMSRGLRIAEIPEHIGGAKQGLDSRQLMSLTEMRARKLSESLGSIQKSS